MKVTTTVEQLVCDICKKNEAYTWDNCIGCGKAFCHVCAKTHAKKYTHGVHFSGGGDGVYCLECDAKLREGKDPLHAAFVAIDLLKREGSEWYASFDLRRKAAEARLKSLQERK